MKQVCEKTPLLEIKQAEIAEIQTENGRVTGVVTSLGAQYTVSAAVVATGTYLNGRIHVGQVSYESGPDAAPSQPSAGKKSTGTGAANAAVQDRYSLSCPPPEH